jgi:MMP 1-O-methyltransferase
MLTRLKNYVRRFADRLVHWRIRRYLDIQGWLTPAEAICLYRLARRLPPGSTILEIGSWKGKSTYCLARGLRSGKVIAIDPFNASGEPGSAELYDDAKGGAELYESFVETMRSLGVSDKVEAWRGFSTEFVGRAKGIQLLFIDGDHSVEGCRFDYENFATAIAPGGYLLFHDYDASRAELGPTWVVNRLAVPSGEFLEPRTADSIWFARKARS